MPVTTTATTMDLNLPETNKLLAAMSVEQRVSWAAETFGPAMALMSSMQKTASVLMHIFHRLKLDNQVLFGDTGYHFHETLELRDQFARDYNLKIFNMYPELTPEQQDARYDRKLYKYVDGQPQCCRMRKEEPFLKHVKKAGIRCVLIGARQIDGGARSKLDVISRDPRIGGYSIHPLFDWTDVEVKEYLATHDVPVHPLHAQNYPSIGCQCCTTPVAPGEDARAGRWRHLRAEDGNQPVFCGINFTDGSGI